MTVEKKQQRQGLTHEVIITREFKSLIHTLMNDEDNGIAINQEWSGILMFKIIPYVDSITKEPRKTQIIPVTVIPKHLGEPTRTEMENENTADPRTITLRSQGLYQGVFHSHVNMGVFFSGTDMSHMRESFKVFGSSFFISLIGNKKGEFCAKVSYHKEERWNPFFKEIFQLENEMTKIPVIEDCEIVFDNEESFVPLNEDMLNDIKYIKEQYAKEQAAKKNLFSPYSRNFYGGINYPNLFKNNKKQKSYDHPKHNITLDDYDADKALLTLWRILSKDYSQKKYGPNTLSVRFFELGRLEESELMQIIMEGVKEYDQRTPLPTATSDMKEALAFLQSNSKEVPSFLKPGGSYKKVVNNLISVLEKID